MDKRIAKNRKKVIDAMVENAKHIKIDLPANTYDVHLKRIPSLMIMYSHALLTMSENGHCRFSLHGSLFCTFKVPDSVVGMVFK